MSDATAVDAPLDGPAIGALTQAIEAAFTVDELDDLTTVTFSQGLFTEYVAQGLPGHSTTMRLIQALNRRGIVPQFLRAVRKARPQKESLLVLIRRYCPEAMDDAPPAAEDVEKVQKGIIQLRQALADPAVKALVAASRQNLARLADDLKRLQAYKALHDALHKVQIRQYRQLVDEIKRLRTDPMSATTLGSQILELKMICGDARKEAETLADTPTERRPETKWIRNFEQALKDLGTAVEKLDDMAARVATSSIADVIRLEPPRVNSQLRGSAESLPLDSLIATVGDVVGVDGLETDKKQALDKARAALDSLWARLRGTVAEHDCWQDVETQLWGTDVEVERIGTDQLGEFLIYWTKAKQRIATLWQLDPSAPWVVRMQLHSGEVEAAMAAVPIDCLRTRLNYGRFRNEAMTQFFSVDTELNRLCEEVVRIGQPLAAVLNELAQ